MRVTIGNVKSSSIFRLGYDVPDFITADTTRRHNGRFHTHKEKTMSDEQTQEGPEVWASILAYGGFESTDDALETLIKLRDVDFGDIFTDQDTELDSEGDEGLSIQFYREDVPTRLRLAVDADNELSVRLTVSGDNCEHAESILNKILEEIGSVTADEITVFYESSRGFIELDLPIKESTEFRVTGMRLNHDGVDHIIQDRESNTTATSTYELDEEIEHSVDDSFVAGRIDQTKAFIEEVL